MYNELHSAQILKQVMGINKLFLVKKDDDTTKNICFILNMVFHENIIIGILF